MRERVGLDSDVMTRRDSSPEPNEPGPAAPDGVLLEATKVWRRFGTEVLQNVDLYTFNAATPPHRFLVKRR